MNGKKKTLLVLLITLIFASLDYYFKLPAINLHNRDFYYFILRITFVYCIVSFLLSKSIQNIVHSFSDVRLLLKELKKVFNIPLIICAVLLTICILGSVFSSVIFNSSRYEKLLNVQAGDFASEVVEISYDKIPLLDKTSAERLGDRKLGELSDMVSQFEVLNDYVQINYQGSPVRVATLKYGDIFKWFNNYRSGLPAYLIIDMVSQNVEIVRLSEGIKYSNADYFGRNIHRHLRCSYPTYMFADPHFEIDDNGKPFWICPRIKMTIGLFGGKDINGAVIVDAVTGQSEYYESQDVPTWVDQVYDADLIIAQYDYHGKYQNGFFNSLFGQKNVTVTTTGYNYIAMNDDVYVYTGVTSVGGDESNVGFILSNQRTKTTRYYSCAGAEEYSAMSSAEGIVQHLGYRATFPLLLNISNEPTYFMALKDNAGLVKMYAMVNVKQYNIVATGASIVECEKQYHNALSQNSILAVNNYPMTKKQGRVEEIRTAVVNGNSIYFFRLEGDSVFYSVSSADCLETVIVNVGDIVEISGTTDQISDIVSAGFITVEKQKNQ